MMEAVSEVVLRNREAIGAGPVLLVDSPPDGLAAGLQSGGVEVRASNQMRGDCNAVCSQGVATRFEAVPLPAGDEELVILRLPREKDRLDMVLHALTASMNPSARLWIVGEKRAGINSTVRLLDRRFASVRKLDNARHCSLIEAVTPAPAPPFDLDRYLATTAHDTGQGTATLCSFPGVFAHGRVDTGTALLLAALRNLPVDGDVLDFACGNGVIGIDLLARGAPVRITALDASALALEAARRSFVRNGFDARLLASDGWREADGRHDWIVSNPPFHRGVHNDLDTAGDFLRGAGTFLKRGGRIIVVFNRHLPYERWARARYRTVDRLTDSREFTVIQASEPR
jgi:16S rRNA (guanine1207-N2)-methyltransferase